jgi:hypothetical protein
MDLQEVVSNFRCSPLLGDISAHFRVLSRELCMVLREHPGAGLLICLTAFTVERFMGY